MLEMLVAETVCRKIAGQWVLERNILPLDSFSSCSCSLVTNKAVTLICYMFPGWCFASVLSGPKATEASVLGL